MDVVLSPQQSYPAAMASVPIGGGLIPLIADSVSRFLAAARSPSPDLSAFKSVFTRLLQSDPNPPLEVIWIFAAVSFHEPGAAGAGPEELLQLITTLGANAGAEKSVALLAPVIAEIYHLTLTAEGKKARKNIERLLEAVVSYVSICSGSRAGCEERLLPTFEEVVKVWCVGRFVEKSGIDAVFPLVGDEVRANLRKEGCQVGYLAAVVVVEAFLLRLCLKVTEGKRAAKVELQKELKIWSVSSITAFQNRMFIDILLQMALDRHNLPFAALLSAEDQMLVRDVLNDSLILVDYSVCRGVEFGRADNALMSTLVTKLVVACIAVQEARRNGDHAKAMSYINAFTTSSISSQLVKWVTTSYVNVRLDSNDRPVSAAPEALMKWLMHIEDKGMTIFGERTSKLRQKLIFDELKAFKDPAIVGTGKKKSDGEEFVCAEKDEEGEDVEMMDEAFIAAAQSMKSAENGQRKRKSEQKAEDSVMKCMKYNVETFSVRDALAPEALGASSGSEVDDPSSDDDMQGSEFA